MKNKDLDKLLRDAFAWMEREKKKEKNNKGAHAGECLSEETISDYLSSRLPDSEKERAEAHLSLCHNCRQVLTTSIKVEALEEMELKAMEKQAKLSEVLGEKITEGISAVTEILNISLAWAKGKLVLKETNADSLIPFPLKDVPIPIPVRGESPPSKTDLPPITKMAKDYKIIIHISKEGEKSCELRCEGLSRAPKREGAKIKAYLIQDDRILSSYPFEKGRILLHGITPGEYKMIIRKADEVIAIVSLKIETENGK